MRLTDLQNLHKTDLHMHTRYSDGNNTPEEMILSAINKGLVCIGITEHSPIEGEDWCMDAGREKEYFEEISFLKSRYSDRIRILCGLEQDYFSPSPEMNYDYIIGSVHGVRKGDDIVWADVSEEHTREKINLYYDGDIISYAEEYYSQLAEIKEKTDCDIIGHFDLLTKFNEGGRMFDENDSRYISAWRKAADCLIKENVLFEINTGAMSRGYRKTPYPSAQICAYLKENGAKFVYCSDAHSTESVGFGIN